jgi:hypothetical protein
MRTALLAAAALAASTATALADDDTDTVPTNLELTQLQRRVEALEGRAWIAKATADRLKEQLLGGGFGAQATIVHVDEMGSAFRLVDLTYAVDGDEVFHQHGDDLYRTDRFDILTGPIAPGAHELVVIAKYRGHGYGVFRYLDKYTFTVRSSHAFTAEEGKTTRVEAHAVDRGTSAELRDRPSMRFDVSQ